MPIVGVRVCELDVSDVCIVGTKVWTEAYLLPSDSAPMLELLLTGGFDEEVAMIGFGGVITLFIVGLSVGMIIQQLRKLRI